MGFRRRESIRRLDLDEPFAVVGHLDQEVRHDVTALLAIATFSAVCGRAVEESDLKVAAQLSPGIPNRQGLLLDVENLRAGHESHGRGPFELALAAD